MLIKKIAALHKAGRLNGGEFKATKNKILREMLVKKEAGLLGSAGRTLKSTAKTVGHLWPAQIAGIGGLVGAEALGARSAAGMIAGGLGGFAAGSVGRDAILKAIRKTDDAKKKKKLIGMLAAAGGAGAAAGAIGQYEKQAGAIKETLKSMGRTVGHVAPASLMGAAGGAVGRAIDPTGAAGSIIGGVTGYMGGSRGRDLVLEAMKKTKDTKKKKQLAALLAGTAVAGGVGGAAFAGRKKEAGWSKEVVEAMKKFPGKHLGGINAMNPEMALKMRRQGAEAGLGSRGMDALFASWTHGGKDGAMDSIGKRLLSGGYDSAKKWQDNVTHSSSLSRKAVGIVKALGEKSEALGDAAKASAGLGITGAAAAGGIGLAANAYRKSRRAKAIALAAAKKKKLIALGVIGAGAGVGIAGVGRKKEAGLAEDAFRALPDSVKSSLLDLGMGGINKLKTVAKGGLAVGAGVAGYGGLKAIVPWLAKRRKDKKVIGLAEEANRIARKGQEAARLGQEANTKALKGVGIGVGALGLGLGANALLGGRKKEAGARLAPTTDAVNSVIGRISNALTNDEVMRLMESIDTEGEMPTGVSKRAKDMMAKSRLDLASLRRLDELAKPAGNTLESIRRMGAAMGPGKYLGAVGGLGIIGASIYKAIQERLDVGRQETVLNKILVENKELDIDKARGNFEALKLMAPDVAKNDALATGFVTRMDEFDVLDMAPAEMASQIQLGITSRMKPRNGVTHIDDALSGAAGLVLGS